MRLFRFVTFVLETLVKGRPQKRNPKDFGFRFEETLAVYDRLWKEIQSLIRERFSNNPAGLKKYWFNDGWSSGMSAHGYVGRHLKRFLIETENGKIIAAGDDFQYTLRFDPANGAERSGGDRGWFLDVSFACRGERRAVRNIEVKLPSEGGPIADRCIVTGRPRRPSAEEVDAVGEDWRRRNTRTAWPMAEVVLFAAEHDPLRRTVTWQGAGMRSDF